MRTYKLSYYNVHNRLYRLPVQGPCSQCGSDLRVEWALLHTAPEVLTDRAGRRFSPDLTDYVRLCRRCHRSYDVLPLPD